MRTLAVISLISVSFFVMVLLFRTTQRSVVIQAEDTMVTDAQELPKPVPTSFDHTRTADSHFIELRSISDLENIPPEYHRPARLEETRTGIRNILQHTIAVMSSKQSSDREGDQR